MKFGDNKPSDEQLWYGNRLAQEGWLVAYIKDWVVARDLIIVYLSNVPREQIESLSLWKLSTDLQQSKKV